jgi:hypothetical protein
MKIVNKRCGPLPTYFCDTKGGDVIALPSLTAHAKIQYYLVPLSSGPVLNLETGRGRAIESNTQVAIIKDAELCLP